MVDTLTIPQEILQALPTDASSGIFDLITILQAAGIIFIIYFIFQIVNVILNIKRYKKIKIIEFKVNSIEEKLDKILDKKQDNNKDKKR